MSRTKLASTHPRPERMMVFVNGNEVIDQLQQMHLRMELQRLIDKYRDGRRVVSTQLFVDRQTIERASERLGDEFSRGCRMVDVDPGPQGPLAPMAAEIVFHAASGSVDYIVVISQREELTTAVRRAADMGCRTAVWTLNQQAPGQLLEAADDCLHLSHNALTHLGFVEDIS